MKRLYHRLYADYLMPSRLRHYEALLVQAQRAGYGQIPVRALLDAAPDAGNARVLVHRHDIDTDLRTTRKMFALECKYQVRASYYFRLSTLDFGLMRDIEAYGSEASYHYEEIADYAKRHRIRSADQLRARLPAMRAEFERNFHRIEERLGHKLRTVASHGDFANRRLRVINHELLADPALRQRCGIECDAYDDALLRRFDLYISDCPAPDYYRPLSPFAAIGRLDRICLLTHPHQWETNWLANTGHNARRLLEEWRWRSGAPASGVAP